MGNCYYFSYYTHFYIYLFYYGIFIYFLILPFMLWRLVKFEIKDTMQHGTAILLGPCSLCIVSYINIIKSPNTVLVWVLYICVLLSLIYVLIMLPKFFSYAFTPAFAGLTFPMAIGTVATQKMIFYLNNTGYENIANIFKQLEGFLFFYTSFCRTYFPYGNRNSSHTKNDILLK